MPLIEKSHNHHHEVFSVDRARHLDTRLRSFLYRPDRLAEKHVRPGNRVLDFGCGPGFFTREFACRVGESGHVIAVDVQDGMLKLLREKLEPEGLMPRVTTHQCAPDALSLDPAKDGKIDIAFTIFVVHEVPDAQKLFREIAALLVPGGELFLAEPRFVVSADEFKTTLSKAAKEGFLQNGTPSFFMSRTALLRKVS